MVDHNGIHLRITWEYGLVISGTACGVTEYLCLEEKQRGGVENFHNWLEAILAV